VKFNEPIDLKELNDAIDQINTKSAPGDDQIHNIYFKKMPDKFKSQKDTGLIKPRQLSTNITHQLFLKTSRAHY
jgi:hypothetical protein